MNIYVRALFPDDFPTRSKVFPSCLIICPALISHTSVLLSLPAIPYFAFVLHSPHLATAFLE